MNDLVSYPLLIYLAAFKAKVNTLLYYLYTYDDHDYLEVTNLPPQCCSFNYSSISNQVKELVPPSLAIPSKEAKVNNRLLTDPV